MPPRVSLVIPTFNCAKYIGRALDSIFCQTLQDFEVVIVDDGSTDETKSALDRYLQDPRVRYVYQENRGPAAARNTGARLSTAPYIHFLDADDALAPDALKLLAAALDAEPLTAWCITDCFRVNQQLRVLHRPAIPNGENFYEILKTDFVVVGMFFRRTAFISVGMYDEALRSREDWDLDIRMIHSDMPFIYLSQPLYYYHGRKGSLSTESTLFLGYTERVLQKHHKSLADAGNARAAKIYADNMWQLARSYFYAMVNIERAAACLLEALTYDPNIGRMLQSKVRRSMRRNFVGTPTYVEHIRLLCCEFEIRTNSQDVIDRLSYLAHRAEQNIPVAHRRTVTVTWSATWLGDEFRISAEGTEDDFEFTAARAVATLNNRLRSRAIAALPDHIRVNAASGLRGGRSFLIMGSEPSGKTTLAVSLMLVGIDITGDELVLLRDGKALAFPQKFYLREDSISRMPRLRADDRLAASIGNPQEGRVIALDPLQFGKPWRITPAPVSTIFYIEPNHGARSTLRRSGKVELMRRLVPCCLPPVSGRRDWLGDLCATVDRAETFVIELGELDSAISKMMSVLG
jgi:glycosyltransferase involved in cell wall biosynthesis